MDPDLADNWFFESVKKYNSLYMYDLQQQVISADWISEQGLCVSISNGRKHEILELSLPDRILVGEEQAALLKDRDFRVETGGFVEDRVTSLSHLPNTRNVVASTDVDNSVSILQIGGENSDLICKQQTIVNKTPLRESSHVGVLSDNQVLFGSGVNDLCLTDVTIGTIISHFTGEMCKETLPISCLAPLDGSTCLACERSRGQTYTIDTRDSKLMCDLYASFHSNSIITSIHSNSCHNSSESYWTMCVSPDMKYIYQISNKGEFRYMDIRNSKNTVTIATKLSSTSQKINLSCSSSGKYLAMSGFDGNIQIYNINNITTENKLEAIFKHEGHMANSSQPETLLSTVHLWYPGQSELVLSGASDGSLHAWRPAFV
ncbi:WD repeat-containing protein 73 [Patella vulgata]|uniref:WD repeat-containing protein 73 n=1 Tax=Patella vulgata TaxID=6465 RepID=UPI0024A88E24|nr:WD repeat-containing protein 73 [Patella vulgata]XP_050398051.2 WD repeat-containing protein 73 [Patella vulgata]XP_050398054.2 WD repeat-containing protein 73 [Patella vulgata]XP_050398064.2 WD repeat-containing protein 73 [Patella vulgata]XP_050398090.2 WD repeat-containing protein 73 [Patella vulgata]